MLGATLWFMLAIPHAGVNGTPGLDLGLTLAWEKNWLTISSLRLPGGSIRIHYLEAYCRAGSTDADWVKHTVVGHTTELRERRADGKQVQLRCVLRDGVVVDHVITAHADEVDFHLTAHNPTAHRSEAHWAQPCVRLGPFTGHTAPPEQNAEDYLAKCFVVRDGRITRLPLTPWATQARYTPGQVWVPPGVLASDANPRPHSPVVLRHGLIGCFSSDESLVFATAWEPYQELFQGVARCLHSDFRLGGLHPGETVKVRGKVYITSNDPAALLARYQRDFPEHPRPTVTWDAERRLLAVEDLSPDQRTALLQRPEALQVRLADANPASTPPMLGQVRATDHAVAFAPRFPLEANRIYRVRWAWRDTPMTWDIAVPGPKPVSPRLTAIYPSAATVPENLLKFYLHFDRPMSRGEAYAHLQLLDAAGRTIPDAFLELGEELWDATGTRCTLLFDPGRVKRELVPNQTAGSPLRSGQKYTLVVKPGWRDAEGNALPEGRRKDFAVGPAEHARLDATTWQLVPPASDATQPLRVTFPKPLDHALLHRVLAVVGPDGQDVAGTIVTTREETCWEFHPKAAWRRGVYRLRIDSTLEDLAGNNLRKPFEVDAFDPFPKGTAPPATIELTFAIR